MKKARAAGFAVAAVAIVAGILLIPTPYRIQGTLVLSPAKPAEIYAEVEGRLVTLNVRDGEYVKKDTVLAELSNPEKLKEQSQLNQEQVTSFAKARWYEQSPELEHRRQARQFEESAEKIEPRIQKLQEQIGKLTLIAPQDGMAIGVPHHETIGQWLEPGKPFCEIGDPKHLEAHLIVDQSDIDLIARNNPTAWVKVYGTSERTYKSYVSKTSPRNREEIAPELTNMAGGEVSAKSDPKTGAAKPTTAVFEVVIPVDNLDLRLQPGLRGFAKIDGGTHTFGWWLWRLITKTFHFSI